MSTLHRKSTTDSKVRRVFSCTEMALFAIRFRLIRFTERLTFYCASTPLCVLCWLLCR